jgi:hypothetical protein
MKLLDHVLKIRQLIAQAISNRFERLGLTSADAAEPPLTEDDRALRARLKDVVDYHARTAANYAEARKLAINECTFTLFNRLAALKVMEDKEFQPEVIMRRPEHGGRSFEHNAWLENNPAMRIEKREGLLEFFEFKFSELAEHYPIFRADHPYAIMPLVDEFNEIIDAFNDVSLDADCGTNIWRGDDILGWLYENFNVVEKQALKESGEKTEYDKVSLQSQVYTPQWVVKFLVDNSVGKMYLEMFPTSKICDLENEDGSKKYLIANRPTGTKPLRPVKPLDQWRIIDPACGSGNFLIYTFTLLYDLYLDQIENFDADYSRREIPKLIIENNLYGIDLDERAAQLSNIALRIKARELGGSRAKTPEKTHVVSSHFFLPRYEEVEDELRYSDWDERKHNVIRKIWIDLRQASKFGSLVRVEEPIAELAEEEDAQLRCSMGNLFADTERDSLFSFKSNAVDSIRDIFKKYVATDSYTSTKVEDALSFLDMLSNPFDVAVANPPYTDSADFGVELKEFVEENYKKPYKFHVNLYAAFIRRCWELTHDTGKVAMIHPHTFMFIKSFEDVRRFILDESSINVMVDFGLDRVNLFGPGILLDATFYTLDKGLKNEKGIFFDITNGLQEKYKKGVLEEAYEDVCHNKPNSRAYTLKQEKLRYIKSAPFIYWISDDFREKFGKETFGEYLKAKKGLGTDNIRFFRFWWEVNKQDISQNYAKDGKKWVSYLKGGPYCKWYGNIWLVLNWANNGAEVKAHPSLNMRNPDTYFKPGIACSLLSSKGCSFRLQPENCIYDSTTRSIFLENDIYPREYFLGVLNSKLAVYILGCLNATVATNSEDVHRIPMVSPNGLEIVIKRLVLDNVNIKKDLSQYSLVEPLFQKSPISSANDARVEIRNYFNYENTELTKVLLNEAIINNVVFEIYELTDQDRRMVLEKEGVPVGSLPVSSAAYDTWVQQNGEWSVSEGEYTIKLHLEISDNQPQMNFETLYQKNYEWEDFCTQNHVNPIEAWYQFKNSNVLPAQRTQTLAFELITDVIRTLLEKDDDGVMPLVERTGEGTVADRIQQEMFERGYSSAQFSQIVNLLGMPLERYLRDRFFAQLSDHLNLFMYLPKTPFIWHLTSGPRHAMELYVSIYKWSRNTLSRVKSVYCANRENALRDRLVALAQSDAADATTEAADIRAQLTELNEFTAKLDSLLASDYNPKLDDGVGKNIAPLQKAGLLSYAVLKETGGAKSQLNKFLNADW